MAQPAGFLSKDNRTEPTWNSRILDHSQIIPPCKFKIWFDQFIMTVTVKENMDPEKLLQDPKLVIEEPALRPQKPRSGGDATALSPDEMLRRALKI